MTDDERSMESILFEGDYWKAILDDTRELNTLIGQTAAGLLEVAPTQILVLSVAVMSLPKGKARSALVESIDIIQERITATMLQLSEMQEVIARTLGVIDGRSTVLNQERGTDG